MCFLFPSLVFLSLSYVFIVFIRYHAHTYELNAEWMPKYTRTSHREREWKWKCMRPFEDTLMLITNAWHDARCDCIYDKWKHKRHLNETLLINLFLLSFFISFFLSRYVGFKLHTHISSWMNHFYLIPATFIQTISHKWRLKKW